MADLFAFKTEFRTYFKDVETDNCLHDTENHCQYLNAEDLSTENIECHSFCDGYEPGCGGRTEECSNVQDQGVEYNIVASTFFGEGKEMNVCICEVHADTYKMLNHSHRKDEPHIVVLCCKTVHNISRQVQNDRESKSFQPAPFFQKLDPER